MRHNAHTVRPRCGALLSALMVSVKPVVMENSNFGSAYLISGCRGASVSEAPPHNAED